jgi:hypothetical protein
VITPSVFSSTSWVRRRISDQEWSSILDLPDVFLQQFLSLGVVFKMLDSFADPGGAHQIQGATPNTNRACLEPKDNPILSPLKDKENIGQVEPSSDRVLRNTKATKNDDAEVPVYLWNESIVADGVPRKLLALDVIRHFALRWWKKNTTRDFLRWLNQKYPLALRPSGGYIKDRKAGVDCLSRCANSSWWEWNVGSRPLFWRWPEEYRTTIRDGVRLWIKGPLPEYRVPQRGERTNQPEMPSKAS